MRGRSRSTSGAKTLSEYASLARLGHSPERLAELAPEVLGLYARLRELWEIDLGDVEMAVSFTVVDDERS